MTSKIKTSKKELASEKIKSLLAKAKEKREMAKGGKIKEVDFENSNLILYGGGVDTNGNHIVKIGFPNSRAFSIKTNGVLKNTNYILKSKDVHQLEKEEIYTIEKEVVEYVKDFGSKEQKAKLKTYSTYSDGGMMAKGGEVDEESHYFKNIVKRNLLELKEDIKNSKNTRESEFYKNRFDVQLRDYARGLGISENELKNKLSNQYAKGGRVGKDTYLNPPENPSYMISRDAKKTQRAKPSGYRYTNEGAKRLKIDNPKAYVTEEHKAKYKGKYFTKNGVEHRYIYIERRADKADMRRGKPFLKSGGYIPNEYAGHTAEEIWGAWSIDQKEHFLKDHFHSLTFPQMVVLSQERYKELPNQIKNAVKEHIEEGEYEHGGEMEEGGMVYEEGGEVKVFSHFMKAQIDHIKSLKSVSEKKKLINILLDNMHDYVGSDIQKRIATDNLKYALQQKTGSEINHVLTISLNALN